MSFAAQQTPPLRKITPRRQQDVAELMEVWVASWRATYADIDFEARRDWFATHLAALEGAGALTLCLRVGSPDEVKGFVVVDPATGWLDQICVHPDQFGEGAAEALMDAARRASPHGIRLDVNADNRRALRFYDREGFKLIGEGALSQSGRSTVVLEWLPQTSALTK
jgi:putative acetyltransferase